VRDLYRRHAQHVVGERIREQEYGKTRAIISTDFSGYKFVAVGSELHYAKEWRTFPDFLSDYVKRVFGSEWGNAEIARPLAERHPFMQWYDHYCRFQREHGVREENGLYSAIPDGTSAAYLLLAYDLYVLRHHDKLQKKVVKRLRHADQFPGAHYELFVAATFIRAGFEIDYEDETDLTRRHPEFIAKHPGGLAVGVEAKARQRDVTATLKKGMVKPGIQDLLRNAAGKQTGDPFAVFVELSLPPEGRASLPSWVGPVKRELNDVIAELGGHSPFDLVMFTNIPHRYGEAGEPDPPHHFYAIWPPNSRIPDVFVDALGRAAKQHENVPQEFPAED
jgi:hypothetical protein